MPPPATSSINIETSGRQKGETRHFKDKIENIQACRGIAVLLVLFLHLGQYEQRIFSGHALIASITKTGGAGVDLFFVISGFVMVTITRRRFQGLDGAKTFLTRRAARIFPLYWFYSLICLPIFLFRPEMMVRDGGAAGISILRSILLLPSCGQPLVGQGWTLVHEMYFYVVFALSLLRPEKERSRILCMWGVVILASACLPAGYLHGSPTLALITNPMTLEFLVGCAIASLVNRGISRYSVPSILFAPITFVVASLMPPELNRVLLFIIPAALLVYGATSVEARHQYQFPRWLRYMGDVSYSLYLSHILVLSLIGRLWTSLRFWPSAANNLLFICVSACACIAFAVLTYLWLEKPLLASSYAIASKLAFPGLRTHRRT